MKTKIKRKTSCNGKIVEKSLEEIWNETEKSREDHLREVLYKQNEFKSTMYETITLIKSKNIPAKVVEFSDNVFFIRTPNAPGCSCTAFQMNGNGFLYTRYFSSEQDLNEKLNEEKRKGFFVLYWTLISVPLKIQIASILNDAVWKNVKLKPENIDKCPDLAKALSEDCEMKPITLWESIRKWMGL